MFYYDVRVLLVDWREKRTAFRSCSGLLQPCTANWRIPFLDLKAHLADSEDCEVHKQPMQRASPRFCGFAQHRKHGSGRTPQCLCLHHPTHLPTFLIACLELHVAIDPQPLHRSFSQTRHSPPQSEAVNMRCLAEIHRTRGFLRQCIAMRRHCWSTAPRNCGM